MILHNYQEQKNISTIFAMILFAIVLDESLSTILLANISSMPDSHNWLISTFQMLSIPCTLLLAAWSDFHKRRKTFIFSLSCLFISILLVVSHHIIDANWTLVTAVFVKAMGGNAMPIALATLANIVSQKQLRSYLAIAICAISVGSWVPIYFKANLFWLELTITIATLACLAMSFFWFEDYKFDNDENRKITSFKKFYHFAKNEIISISKFVIIPVVSLCFLSFVFSEASFYQILLRGELLQNNNYYPFSSLYMAIGYYVGTVLLLISRKHSEDDKYIKIGFLFSIVSIFTITISNLLHVENDMFKKILISLFSCGFALFIPSIFSHLSKVRKANEQGKIYGLLDSFDSVAIIWASWLITKIKETPSTYISLLSLTLFLTGFIISIVFIKSIEKIKNV